MIFDPAEYSVQSETPGRITTTARLLSYLRPVEVLGSGSGSGWVERHRLVIVDTLRRGRRVKRRYLVEQSEPYRRDANDRLLPPSWEAHEVHPNNRRAPISQPFGPASAYEDYRPDGYWSTGSTGPLP